MRERSDAVDRVEQDFIDALGRLQDNKPTQPALRKKSLDGKLKINVMTVSMEAGHSRTLIGHKGCKYPETRRKVLDAAAKTSPLSSASSVLDSLREDSEELRRRVHLLVSHNAALVRRMQELERQLKIERARAELAGLGRAPNRVVGDTAGKTASLRIKPTAEASEGK